MSFIEDEFFRIERWIEVKSFSLRSDSSPIVASGHKFCGSESNDLIGLDLKVDE